MTFLINIFKQMFLARVLFISAAILVASTAASLASGYDVTLARWNEMRKEAQKYSSFLENFYAHAYASVSDPNQAHQIFCQQLQDLYPGSYCGDPVSYFVQGDQIEVVYQSGFKIGRIIQRMGNMQRTLVFDVPFDAYAVMNGTSRVTVNMLYKDPQQFYFEAQIPSMERLAKEILTYRPKDFETQQHGLAPLSILLNDVYYYRLSKVSGLSMDIVAERMLDDIEFRQYVIENVKMLYLNPTPNTGPKDIDPKLAVPYTPESGLSEVVSLALPLQLDIAMDPSFTNSRPFSEKTNAIFHLLFGLLVLVSVIVFLIFAVKLNRSVKLAQQRKGTALSQKNNLADEPQISEPIAETQPDHELLQGLQSSAEQLTQPSDESEAIHTEEPEVLTPQDFSLKIYEFLLLLALPNLMSVKRDVKLSEVINPNGSGKERVWWKINPLDKETHLDFVVCEPSTAKVLAVVFLQDRSFFTQQLPLALYSVKIETFFFSEETFDQEQDWARVRLEHICQQYMKTRIIRHGAIGSDGSVARTE